MPKKDSPNISDKVEPFNKFQLCAIQLMYNDLKFLYTILNNQNIVTESYFVALLPYLGVIIDGVEDWINAYNNSSKYYKLNIQVFSSTEKDFYEKMRESIKLLECDFENLYNKIKCHYEDSVKYFSSKCHPIAKSLELYDIYGVLTCDGIPCDNTILDQCYFPYFSFDSLDKDEDIKKMTVIAGKYIGCFNVKDSYRVDSSMLFDTKDYGGFNRLNFGNEYNDKFLLFIILCQVNFLLYSVDKFFVEEFSTKLRFGYILYYYLCDFITELNKKIRADLFIDRKYYSQLFRDTMAHYKFGISINNEEEIISNDYMLGLTQKYFKEDYYSVKSFVYAQLESLSKQISKLLNFCN